MQGAARLVTVSRGRTGAASEVVHLTTGQPTEVIHRCGDLRPRARPFPRNRQPWPSDRDRHHELQLCKLPTVWITPVENQHLRAADGILVACTGSGRGLRERALRGVFSMRLRVIPKTQARASFSFAGASEKRLHTTGKAAWTRSPRSRPWTAPPRCCPRSRTRSSGAPTATPAAAPPGRVPVLPAPARPGARRSPVRHHRPPGSQLSGYCRASGMPNRLPMSTRMAASSG